MLIVIQERERGMLFMGKKAVSTIMLTLLLTSISMAFLNSQMFIVSAEETHDVAITGVVPDKTTVVIPDYLLVTVYCANPGTEYESVILTVFLDSPNYPYCWANITLSPGYSHIVTFSLFLGLYDLGTWNLVASLSIVPGETNTSDNVYIYGPITVTTEETRPFTLDMSPLNSLVGVGELIFFEGVVRDSLGNGIANTQVGVNDPITQSCTTMTTDANGHFTYSVVAKRAGAFLFAFYVDSLTETCIVNVGMNPMFSKFPELKVKNVGEKPVTAVLTVDGEEKGRVNINTGETKELIKVHVFKPEIVPAAETCPVPLGGVEGCIDTTGTISVTGGEGIRGSLYMSRDSFGGCIGVGGAVPVIAELEGLLCVGSDGVTLQGTGGPEIAHGVIQIKIVSFDWSALSVSGHSPVSLLLTDPSGKKVGFDPRDGFIDEIERATYTGPHIDPQVISIPRLQEGRYTISVFGLEDGDYHLNIKSMFAGNITSDRWINGTIALGQTLTQRVYIGPSGLPIETTPLSVSINPLSGSILVGQSVTFTSTVSGGYTPYSYQWYLNGNPFSGATSSIWTFTPSTSGIYYVHLKITDSDGNTTQSETARITVATVPVGGYSIPIQGPATVKPITPYLILTAILTIAFTTIKRKTTRKTKQQ